MTSAWCLALLAAAGGTGEPNDPTSFSTPIRISGPAAVPISKLLYPTPVLHDLDGDGRQEMVLGDLMGAVWVCERFGDEGMDWSDPRPVESDGKPLKFDNW